MENQAIAGAFYYCGVFLAFGMYLGKEKQNGIRFILICFILALLSWFSVGIQLGGFMRQLLERK